MKVAFIFLVLLFMTLTSISAFACSCMESKNFQQVIQDDNVIVAKVKTLSSVQGLAKVQIEKYYKNASKEANLEVLGQDGVNCNGYNVPTGQTGILAFKKVNGRYETVSCADSVLNIKADKQIIYVIGAEKFSINETELQQLINFEIQPQVKGLLCQSEVRRLHITQEGESDRSYDIHHYENFDINLMTPKNEPVYFNKEVDLSSLGKNIFDLGIHAEIEKKSESIYTIDVTVKDPFTGLEANGNAASVDLKETSRAFVSYLSRNTNMDGSPRFDLNQPWLSHTTRTLCYIQQGAPLVSTK